MRTFQKFTSGLLLAVLMLTGCNFPLFSTPPAPGGSAAPTPFQPSGGTPPPTAAETATPEEVVQAFLVALNGGPDGWQPFLTADLRESLDPAAPLTLLNVDGPLQEFEVEAGAVDPELRHAQVQVRLSAGESQVQRTFTLLQEEGAWHIASVSGGQ